ncbi:MAG: hypothetical protein H7239_01080 [Flavobacterium sp.]|nr:hypothetical protein [Flavobacterium sp.]
MKEEHRNVINKINGTRSKIYYRLNQLNNMTGMSERSLKYRMKTIKEKYKDIPVLLNRSGREWEIHYTLIFEFLPKYKKNQTNIINHKWETCLSWNTKDSYDVKYHVQLINEVKEQLPSANIAYVVEQDQRGVNHIHAVTDEFKENVEVAVATVLEKYLAKKDYRSQIEKINNNSSITSYFRKNGEMTII